MKLINRFLALLLATVLTFGVSLWILAHTLGNAAFLEARADQTQVYAHISAQIPGLPEDVLRTQIQSFLPQLIDFLGKNAAAPAINLPGIMAEPLTIAPPNPQITNIIHVLGQVQFWAPFALVGLVLVIMVIARRRRWRVLAGACLQAAIGLGITAGLLWLSPALVQQNLQVPELAPFKDALTPFFVAVLHDTAWQFVLGALALLAAAVLMLFVNMVAGLKERLPKRPKPSPPAEVARAPREF